MKFNKNILLLLSSLIAGNINAGTLYAVKTTGDISTTTPIIRDTSLIEIASNTFTVTSVARIILGGNQVYLDGLALTSDGRLFGFVNSEITSVTPTTAATSQLVSIDPTTAVATAIGSPVSSSSVNGAGFDMNNQLYALNAVNGTLVQVSLADGSHSSPVTITGTSISSMYHGDIAFDIDNNAYIVSHNDSVMPLDIVTGVAGTALFPPPLDPQGRLDTLNGMAVVDNNSGYYLEGTVYDEVVTIGSMSAPSSGGARISLSVPPTSTLVGNAGSMDLAGMPNKVYAVNNTSSTEVDTPIIGIDVLSNDSQFLSGSLAETLELDTTFTLTLSAGGTATYNGSTINYTPAVGFVGIETITYQVCVPSGSCTTATVTVTVSVTPTNPTTSPKAIPTLGTIGIFGMAIMLLGLVRRRFTS